MSAEDRVSFWRLTQSSALTPVSVPPSYAEALEVTRENPDFLLTPPRKDATIAAVIAITSVPFRGSQVRQAPVQM
jgi:hypothetical protein